MQAVKDVAEKGRICILDIEMEVGTYIGIGIFGFCPSIRLLLPVLYLTYPPKDVRNREANNVVLLGRETSQAY